jgi:hypothetical protein
MREDRIVNKRVIDREARAERRRQIREYRSKKHDGMTKIPTKPKPKKPPVPKPIPDKTVRPEKPKPTPKPKPPQPPIDATLYPIEFVPLKNLDYRWAAPIFDKGKQDRLLRRFAGQEQVLSGEKTNHKNAIEARMKAVFDSFSTVGMKNPLAVKQHDYV